MPEGASSDEVSAGADPAKGEPAVGFNGGLEGAVPEGELAMADLDRELAGAGSGTEVV